MATSTLPERLPYSDGNVPPEDTTYSDTPYAPSLPAHAAPATPPTIITTFTETQIALIKQQIAPGVSDSELQLFIEVCKQTGLNPFMRQIYAISRNVREQAPDGAWRSVRRMTIQTGIDGYRLLAARTGALAGIDDVVFDTEDVAHPNRASVTVWRFAANGKRVPFTATARWTEYVQVNKDSQPQGLWARMPYLMLGKCCEALALRKAFPAELSGVYTAEEMAQADNPLPTAYVEQETAPVSPQPAPAAEPQPALTNRERLAAIGMKDAEYDEEFRRVVGSKTRYNPADRAKWDAHVAELERIHADLQARVAEQTMSAIPYDGYYTDPPVEHDLRAHIGAAQRQQATLAARVAESEAQG